MDKSQLQSMTKQELSERAKDLNLSGFSRMSKAELVQLILDNTKSEPVAETKNSRTKKTKASGAESKSVSRTVSETTTAVVDFKDEAEKSKYYVGGGIREQFYEESFVFPQEYGSTKIVLMVRDPYWMYAYWEVTYQKIEEMKKKIGDQFNNSKLILRVKDTTNSSADDTDKYFDIHLAPGANNWYINVPSDCSDYIVDLGFLSPDGKFYLVARSNRISVPRVGVSDEVDEEYATIDELDKIYALSGGLSIGMSSGEIREMMKKRIEQAISSGAFSGAVSSWGSGGLVKKEKKERNFFLVVNTELIVYGATVPDAELTIQGKPKKLNPDGTFSVRFALPDGLQEIPVKAISSDKIDEITITPIVSKKTV
ncbi:MAG: DUF4912 domain-containing protein [Candidatus Auribacterota bacterium]